MESSKGIKENDYGFAMPTWKLLNYNGETILEGIEQIYDLVYKIPDDNKEDEVNYMIFENKLRELEYKFVGDKFYIEY